MRLRSSGGYYTNDVLSHCISDEEHSAIDQTNSIEPWLVGSIQVIELDYIWIKEHSRGGSEVQAAGSLGP